MGVSTWRYQGTDSEGGGSEVSGAEGAGWYLICPSGLSVGSSDCQRPREKCRLRCGGCAARMANDGFLTVGILTPASAANVSSRECRHD